jgi:hypothetical protein
VEEIVSELYYKLLKKLDRLGDQFLPSSIYLDKWGYSVDEKGTVPYEW